MQGILSDILPGPGVLQFILTQAAFIVLLIVIMKCLHSRCPWLPNCMIGQDAAQENTEVQVDPGTLGSTSLSDVPCPKATSQEMEEFFKDLHSPTDNRVVRKKLLHKLLVFMTKEVDHRGACLMLADMGISLEVPPDAVSLGRVERVSLVLVWDLLDSPPLLGTQALISPVVYCGPHGASFQQLCTLSFKHCAGSGTYVRVYASDTHLLASKEWEELHNKPSRQNRICITRDECQIKLDHFSLYTSVLETYGRPEVHKWLQLAVFSSPLSADQSHQQIRIYFLNNTPCALQWAHCNEEPFRGSLCGPVQLFEFANTSKDMFLVLKYLSEAGWENIDENASQYVPFLHIWHGKCPFRSFCFRRKTVSPVDSPSQNTSEIIVTMHVFQKDLQEKYLEVLRLHITESGCQAERVSPKPYCNRIPRELFEQLQMLLEPNTVSGNDWRKLASRLGLCGTKIRFMSCQQSPAAATLEFFEELNGSLHDLYKIMLSMERLDCAVTVEAFLNDPLPDCPGLSQRDKDQENHCCCEGKTTSLASECDSGLTDLGSVKEREICSQTTDEHTAIQ
ncbi:UNC5C-like protein isoform X1 [Polypterus senegalus]|uniref:UNC5C-like protein isoform X1 n=1 Tax=Polypterus senegalus TaxID=55291 RepID=UPI00196231A4|nr:UNC5C-like protein isoform X1 [Polypterus senegalus]